MFHAQGMPPLEPLEVIQFEAKAGLGNHNLSGRNKSEDSEEEPYKKYAFAKGISNII